MNRTLGTGRSSAGLQSLCPGHCCWLRRAGLLSVSSATIASCGCRHYSGGRVRRHLLSGQGPVLAKADAPLRMDSFNGLKHGSTITPRRWVRSVPLRGRRPTLNASKGSHGARGTLHNHARCPTWRMAGYEGLGLPPRPSWPRPQAGSCATSPKRHCMRCVTLILKVGRASLKMALRRRHEKTSAPAQW